VRMCMSRTWEQSVGLSGQAAKLVCISACWRAPAASSVQTYGSEHMPPRHGVMILSSATRPIPLSMLKEFHPNPMSPLHNLAPSSPHSQNGRECGAIKTTLSPTPSELASKPQHTIASNIPLTNNISDFLLTVYIPHQHQHPISPRRTCIAAPPSLTLISSSVSSSSSSSTT